MKVLQILSLACLTAIVSANVEIDWSNVQPIRELLKQHIEEGLAARDSSTRNRRIVNGEEATPGQFPYQVALLIDSGGTGTGLCGGSIISTTAVLSAAHCTSAGVINYHIVAGAHNRVIIEPEQQRRTVPANAFIPHPQYGPALLRNDIAVIRVTANPFTLSARVQAVRLASNNAERHVGAPVTVSGFGRYSDSHNRVPDVLLFTRKTVVSNAVCSQTFPVLVIDSTICAQGDPLINNAVCNGDSGGPLTIDDGSSLQVGVVSFGPPLGCERGHPDGYARVSAFEPWIRSTAGL